MAKHFTKEEIDEIRKQLATRSMRDTDFQETDSLHDGDCIAIVQDGSNRLISADTFHNALQNGPRGYSNYEIAVNNGYEGTEAEWLADPINGVKGVGIHSITQTTVSQEDGGRNEITVKLTDGSAQKFGMLNGSGIDYIAAHTSHEDGGENTITIVMSDGRTKTISFYNGNQGSTAVPNPDEIAIVNDRTTGGSESAWSAEQGKLLCAETLFLGDVVETLS